MFALVGAGITLPDIDRVLAQLVQGGISSERALAIHRAVWQVIRFDSHPLEGAELSDKVAYLKALALTMVADEDIHPQETAVFSALVRTLVDRAMLPELLEWAQNPDLDNDLPRMLATLKKDRAWQQALILDSVMLAYADGELGGDEEELITQLRELVRWDRKTFDQLVRGARVLARATEVASLAWAAKGFSPPESTAWALQARGYNAQVLGLLSENDLGNTLGVASQPISSSILGSVINGTRLSLPITRGQFLPFLHWLSYQDRLRRHPQQENVLQFLDGGEWVDLLDAEAESFVQEEATWSVETGEEQRALQHFSPAAGEAYARWLGFGGSAYQIPQVKGNSEGVISNLLELESELWKKLFGESAGDYYWNVLAKYEPRGKDMTFIRAQISKRRFVFNVFTFSYSDNIVKLLGQPSLARTELLDSVCLCLVSQDSDE